MTTDQKGQIAVLKVQQIAAEKGALVFLPTIPARYDLVLEYQGKLFRAQVKYANGKAQNAEGAVRLDLRRRKRCYTAAEIDVLLVYVPQIDRVCWFDRDVFENRMLLHLRIVPARNGQRNGCVMVDDYVW